MGLLAPGVEFQLAQGTPARRGEITVLLVVVGQVGERLQRLLMRGLAPRHRPLFKFRTVLQEELLQEFAAIQVHGLLQPRRTDRARVQAGMGVACAGRKLRLETRHVERKIAGRIELDVIAGDEQVGRLRGGVADRLAQTEEGLAQIVARGLLGFVGPEQSDQRLAAMGRPASTAR